MKLISVNRFLSYLKLMTGLVVLVCVGIYICRSWHSLESSHLSFKWYILCISWIFLFAATALSALIWKFLIDSKGNSISFYNAFYTYNISMLMRYIPGKVWHLAGRVGLAGECGIDKSKSSISLAEENISETAAAIVIVYLMSGVKILGYGGLIALMAIFFCVIAGNLIMNRKFRRFPPVNIRMIGLATVVFIPVWVLFGLSFFITTRSLMPVDIDHFGLFIGSFTVSWLGGMVAFIVPNGLGVREGLLTAILGSILPAPAIMVAAIVFRLNTILFEIATGGALLIHSHLKFKSELKTE